MFESPKTEDRIIAEAIYMTEHSATVRETAAYIGVGKSTVHKDMTVHLKYISPSLYRAVGIVLARNKSERHIRGGEATKNKYSGIRKKEKQPPGIK